MILQEQNFDRLRNRELRDKKNTSFFCKIAFLWTKKRGEKKEAKFDTKILFYFMVNKC